MGSVMGGAANGKSAYENGAFYMGQESTEGNSESFAEIEAKGESLSAAIGTISTSISTAIDTATANIETATAKRQEYINEIENNKKIISQLQREKEHAADADKPGIEAAIRSYRERNAVLQKKVNNCTKVIEALGADIGILGGLQGNVSTANSALGAS